MAHSAWRRRKNFESYRTERKAVADANKEKRSALSPAQQLKALDARLGSGQGAAQERKRLEAAAAK